MGIKRRTLAHRRHKLAFNRRQITNTKEKRDDMAALKIHSNVYEIKVSDAERDKVIDELMSPSVSREFIEECVRITEELRKKD